MLFFIYWSSNVSIINRIARKPLCKSYRRYIRHLHQSQSYIEFSYYKRVVENVVSATRLYYFRSLVHLNENIILLVDYLDTKSKFWTLNKISWWSQIKNLVDLPWLKILVVMTVINRKAMVFYDSIGWNYDWMV